MAEDILRVPDASQELPLNERGHTCHGNTDISLKDDKMSAKFLEILHILLKDRTTKANIFWATDNYAD